MKVIRTMPDEGWGPVANSAARHRRLSWRAKGLLLELMSYPDGWDTNVDKLVALSRQAGPDAEGREAMRKAMGELERAGYVVHERERGKRGQWITTTAVSDEPMTTDRGTGFRASADRASVTRSSADAASADRALRKNTDTNTDTNTDLSKTGNEYSASLTSFATAATAAAIENDEEAIKQELVRAYKRIDVATEEQRRNGLLILEKRRPRIYRQCRRQAITQMTREDPQTLKGDQASVVIDRLSYKYAALHYAPEQPPWLLRPLARN